MGYAAVGVAVYRERTTGALYVRHNLGMVGWSESNFENAVDYVSFVYPDDPFASGEMGREPTAEEAAEMERRIRQVDQEIDTRFEVFDPLEFPIENNQPRVDYWAWESYWNRGRTDMPGYPPFHASVEEVRQSLSAP